MIKRLYYNYRNLKAGVLFFALSFFLLIFYILFLIQNSNERQVEHLTTMLKNEALSHFENLVVLRRWNADHGGVYIKQHDELKPNPYLEDNTMKSESGETYLRVNPAWMTKQVAQIANKTTNHYYRITSLTPLNPSNAPEDAFEKRALHYLYDHPGEKYFYEIDLKQKKQIDFMGTLRTEKSCIQCHANYRVGEIRGGIHVRLPADDTVEEIDSINTMQYLFMAILALIVLLITVALVYFLKLIRASKDKDELMAQQSRHVAMADLIVSISHHWRQPLNALALYIQDLRDAQEFGELDKAYLDNIIERSMHQINYMSKVIDDFKSLIRDKSTPEGFLLSDIIESSIYFNEPVLIENNVHLAYACACSFKQYEASLEERALCNECQITLYSFPGTLKQVLINLLRNSIDAVARHIPEDSRMIEMRFTVSEEKVLIEVSDNGGGIPKNIQNRVFDPYFTTKDTKESMGMGLYASKKMVENKLAGTIRFENRGEGALFMIEIPLAIGG